MKKQKVQHKRTGVKLSRTNRSKLRRSKKTEVVFRSPGPSPFITKGEDGKVSITNIVGNVSQKSYTTDIGKNARQANKTAKQAKKDRIKQILASAGFDPTIKYTRKEKKKFTRRIKNLLFVQPKPVNLTDEEIKMRFVAEKKRKAELLASRPHKNEIEALMNSFLGEKREKSLQKESKKYRYIIKQQSKEAPQKEIDFLTDYVTAKNEIEAVEVAKSKFRSVYKNSEDKDSLTGLSVIQLDTNQSSYYPKDTILSWTSPEELKEKYSNVASAAQLLTVNIIKI